MKKILRGIPWSCSPPFGVTRREVWSPGPEKCLSEGNIQPVKSHPFSSRSPAVASAASQVGLSLQVSWWIKAACQLTKEQLGAARCSNLSWIGRGWLRKKQPKVTTCREKNWERTCFCWWHRDPHPGWIAKKLGREIQVAAAPNLFHFSGLNFCDWNTRIQNNLSWGR